MAYPWTAYKTWTTGEVLTAADLNNSFSTVITNSIPANIDDYSANSTVMQTSTDPYPAAAVSLATSLSGELERLRYIVKQITGKSQWYVDAAAIGSKGADVASTAALPVLTDGNFFDVTGTTTVTSINTLGVGSVIYLQFDGAVLLTHHSTDLILPGGVNITTATGSVATFVEYASGDWMLINYEGPGTRSIPGTLTFTGALTLSGAVTPSGGLVGTTAGGSATAGHIGEEIRATLAEASGITLTTVEWNDVTSISLTAGDWDISVVTEFGGTVTGTALLIGISTNSGNNGAGQTGGDNQCSSPTMPTATSNYTMNIPSYRVTISGTTTYYSKVRGTFTVGTLKSWGRISARRRR